MPRIPPPGQKIPKGKTGNTQGGSAVVRARQAAKEVAATEPTVLQPYQLARQFLVTMSGGPEIARLAADVHGNDYKVALARAWTIICQTGDLKGLEFFVDRVAGKPRTSISLTGKDGAPLDIAVSLSPEEKLARIKELARARALSEDD